MKITEINQKILEAIQTASTFQQKIWEELLKIRYGHTTEAISKKPRQLNNLKP